MTLQVKLGDESRVAEKRLSLTSEGLTIDFCYKNVEQVFNKRRTRMTWGKNFHSFKNNLSSISLTIHMQDGPKKLKIASLFYPTDAWNSKHRLVIYEQIWNFRFHIELYPGAATKFTSVSYNLHPNGCKFHAKISSLFQSWTQIHIIWIN